eukprot:11188748-Lingulodinium_polyedra.AAC.1
MASAPGFFRWRVSGGEVLSLPPACIALAMSVPGPRTKSVEGVRWGVAKVNDPASRGEILLTIKAVMDARPT